MTTTFRPPSAEDTAIVKLVSQILAKAIKDRATHVYFEPQAKSLQIRIRQDGVLQIALQNLPHTMVAPTIEYLKTSAGIGLKLPAPQLGAIEGAEKSGQVRIEITTLPTQFGDSIIAKIVHIQQLPPSLHHLIPDRELLSPIQQMIQSDRGLILVVGEQDSGKSATVYASLAALDRPDLSIYALDRQFKYTVPGINQIILPDAELETISACLSQYPNVLAVGCIDRLSIATAALTAVAQGCLVFATIRAGTAGQAISQLINLGVSPAQLYTATIGIIVQKQIGQNCPQCRVPHAPSSSELAQLGTTSLLLKERHQYYRANRLNLQEIEQAKQTGTLCPKCQGLGYRGRIGVYETAPITALLKPAFLQGDAERIDLAIQETDMRSFLDLAIKLLQTGDTSLKEVRRCVPPKTLFHNQLAKVEIERENLDLAIDDQDNLATTLYWKQQADLAKTEAAQLLSELENYQQEVDEFEQRIKQSRSQAEQSTRAEIALQLLSVIDVIELARTSIKPQTDREAAIQKGYSMLENKMLLSIKEIGVRVTETVGRKFDSHFHEVVQEIGTHEHQTGTILEEFRRGYTLGDRVLRLAQVKVAVTSRFS